MLPTALAHYHQTETWGAEPAKAPSGHINKTLRQINRNLCCSQGDIEANTFYVLERGTCDAWLYKEAWGEERKVFTYQPGRYGS